MAKEERIRDAFSPLLDGELPGEEREAVEADLAQDAELLRELDELRRIDGLYKGLGATAAPAGFEERLRAALADTRVEETPARTVPFRRWVMPLLAAAACLIAVAAVVLQGLGGSPATERTDMAAVSADDMAETQMQRAAPAAEGLQAEPAPEFSVAQEIFETAPGREAEPEADAFFEMKEETRNAPAPVTPPPAPMMAPPPPATPAEPMPAQVGRDEDAAAFGVGASAPTAAPASPPPPPAREESMRKAAEADGVAANEVTASEAPAALVAGTYRFRFDDGRWVEESYAGERAEPIRRDDPAWRALAEDVRTVLEAQRRPVVLRIGGVWRVTAPAE